MVQKERKSGHWQVERLQFLKREQRGLRLRYAVIDLQPCDLQTAKFSCLLHHKGALIFQIKRPLFWKNGQICPSLVEWARATIRWKRIARRQTDHRRSCR